MEPNIRKSLFAALVLATAGLSVAWAGEFYGKDGMAINGYDPVGYFDEGRPVKGSSQFTVLHKGALFHFANAANREAFAASPDRYAPQYGGYCAYGTAKGYKAKSDPDAFSIVDGKLYLNYSLAIREQWRAHIPEYIAKANHNWPSVQRLSRVQE